MDEEGSVDELMASKKIHIIPLDEKRGKKRGEKTTKSKIWRMEKKKSKKKKIKHWSFIGKKKEKDG